MKNNQIRPVSLPEIQHVRLSNGLQVILMPIHKLPVISIKCLIKAGASTGPSGKSGLVTLLMEILKKGSGNRNADEFSEAVDFLGAGMDTAAMQDFSIVSADFLAYHLETMLDLFSDLILRPHFPEDEFSKSQDRLIAAIQGIMDHPSSLNAHLFSQYFYGNNHPYGIPASGKISEIHSITLRDLIDFYHAAFVPNNAIIVAAGQFDPESLKSLLNERFGQWTPGTPVIYNRIRLTEITENRFIVFNKPDMVQSQIRLGSAGIYQKHPDTFPLLLANHIFGGGFTSRLVEEVRVKRGLTYAISSGFSRSFHQGAFVIGTFTQTDSTTEIVEVIFDVLTRYRSTGGTETELETAVNYLTGLYPLSLETCEHIAGKLTSMAFFNLPDSWIEDYIPNLLSVSMDQLTGVIQEYFPQAGITGIILGNADSIYPQLQSLGPVEVRELSDSDL